MYCPHLCSCIRTSRPLTECQGFPDLRLCVKNKKDARPIQNPHLLFSSFVLHHPSDITPYPLVFLFLILHTILTFWMEPLRQLFYPVYLPEIHCEFCSMSFPHLVIYIRPSCGPLN